MVTGGQDKKVHIWDAKTGKLKVTLDGHSNTVLSVAVSSDGLLVVSGSKDGTARVWKIKDVEGEEQKKYAFDGWWVCAVAFASNEDSFFAGGNNKLIKQYNMETGTEVKVFEGHRAKSSSRTPPTFSSTISTSTSLGLRVSCKDPSSGPSPPPPSTMGLEMTPESSIAQVSRRKR